MYQSVSDVRITRNSDVNYLFDVSFIFTLKNGKACPCYLMGESLEYIQNKLGIKTENYSGIDDGRYMLMV